MMEHMEGKRVLVVGASAGIGRAIALSVADAGATIAVAARRKDLLDELVSAAGGGTAIVADLSNPEDCERLAEEATSALGAIDAVVFTSGAAQIRTLEEMTPTEWATALNTNVVGVNMAIAALVPHVVDKGVIAVMSSEAAGSPYYGMGAYAASKSALEDTMRAWRLERTELRFTTLVVGATTETDFSSSFKPEEMGRAFPIWAAQGKATTDYMRPQDVGTVVASALDALLRQTSVGIESMVMRCPAPLAGVEALHEGVAAALSDT